MRHCDRPGCAEPAASTLGYDQRTQTAWLDELAPEAHPATYDLCRRHAEALSVPVGWRLCDRRCGVQGELHALAG